MRNNLNNRLTSSTGSVHILNTKGKKGEGVNTNLGTMLDNCTNAFYTFLVPTRPWQFS